MYAGDRWPPVDARDRYWCWRPVTSMCGGAGNARDRDWHWRPVTVMCGGAVDARDRYWRWRPVTLMCGGAVDACERTVCCWMSLKPKMVPWKALAITLTLLLALASSSLGGEGLLVMGCCFQRRRISFSSSYHKIKWWLLLKLESDFFWLVDIFNARFFSQEKKRAILNFLGYMYVRTGTWFRRVWQFRKGGANSRSKK